MVDGGYHPNRYTEVHKPLMLKEARWYYARKKPPANGARAVTAAVVGH